MKKNFNKLNNSIIKNLFMKNIGENQLQAMGTQMEKFCLLD